MRRRRKFSVPEIAFSEVTVWTELDSRIEYLIARARYGRKLTALAYCAFNDLAMIKALEADESIPLATRRKLIRNCEASIGRALRLESKHKKKQVTDVVHRQWPPQENQEHVFTAYRTALRRGGRPPTLAEWLEQDLMERPPKVSRLMDAQTQKEQIRDHRRLRQQVIHEMARRFKLPVSCQEN